MKKFLFALLILAAPAVNEAQDYDYLELVKTDGSRKTISTEGLEIDVTPGRFVITNETGENVNVAFADLKSMVFTNVELKDNGDVWNDEEPDDNEKPDNGPSSLDKTFINNSPVDVFAIDGAYMGRFESITDAAHNLSSGIYVMRDENNNTIKIKTGI